jgi:hypothetical protein
LQHRRFVRAQFQSMVREDDPPAVPALPRHFGRGPRPESWLPTAERIRDADFVCGLPISHGRSREQIAQAAVKSHRGHNHDTRLARSTGVLLEGVRVGFDLSGDVQVGNPGA